ncbi:helix-turn-helix domain-containing protein [Paenibacillus tepidiphilus]|uniref:helix-turn-helix domain-containing protein n=1 Tax=Paenibacillus tepidiphilus TaxID=2608683 RepID=UPI0013A573C8|nr:helix-turn-helix domain-containing protein [Paenibacillus tepidiphilus]
MLPNGNLSADLPYICRLMYEAYRIPVFWLDEAGGIQLALPASPVFRPGTSAAAVLAEVAAAPTGSPAQAATGPSAELQHAAAESTVEGVIHVAPETAAGSAVKQSTPEEATSAGSVHANQAAPLEASLDAGSGCASPAPAGTIPPQSPAGRIPLVRVTGYAENFIILRLSGGGCLVIGPSLSSPLSAEHAVHWLGELGIPPSRREEWLHYYRELPVLERTRLYHAAMLLYSLVTGQALPVSELLLENVRLSGTERSTAASPDLDLSYRREHTWLHHEPALENELFRHVRSGDSAGLLQTMASFTGDNYGLLSKKSRLRSQKNLAISSITLATRAAIAGGLFWEIAYTLSDFHIQHIEELQDLQSVDIAQIAALCDFADHVRDSRQTQLSRMSALCQNYIFNHLYEDIPLSKLAGITGLSPSYLSSQFKQENGITVSDYIQRERIEEAKRLLELPGIRLSDIATRLHFNDQSYFTKVFKKYTGRTPRQFLRERGAFF